MSRILALVVWASLALGQMSDTAAINGTTMDQSHAGISGAQVRARNVQTGLERSTQSDAAGRFSIGALSIAGTYEITASKSGFADARVERVTLGAGRNADVTIELSVAGGQTQVVVR